MEQSSKTPPQATEIYFASLVATGLVYLAGVLIYSAIIFFGAFLGDPTGILMVLFGFLTVGVIAAAFAGIAISSGRSAPKNRKPLGIASIPTRTEG